MKNKGLKIGVSFLLVLQMGLGSKAFWIIISILENSGSKEAFSGEQLYLFIAFLVNFIVSIVFVVIIFRNQTTYKKEISKGAKARHDKNKKKHKIKEQQTENLEIQEKKRQAIDKLKTELADINDIGPFTEKVLINISKQYDIMQGIFFVKDLKDNVFRKQGAYAYFSEEELREFTEEVGLSGQVAASKKLLNISNIPDKYITVSSGLGKSSTANLIIFPVLYNNESVGIIEMASFVEFDTFAEEVLMEFSLIVGEKLVALNVTEETAT